MKKSLIFVFALLLFPFVSAEIFIGQLGTVYNVGDGIHAQISIIPSSSLSDHFLVDMICGPVQTNIFNQFIISQSGQQQSINVDTLLINNYFTDIEIILLNQTNSSSGNTTNSTISLNHNTTLEIVNEYDNCYLSAVYGPELSASNSFEISREIILDLDLNLDKFNPGDSVTISGTAEKESGLLIEGFAELFVDSLTISRSAIVSNGEINFNFVIPEDGRSGEHNLTVVVYESNFLGERTNEGIYSDNFQVRQVLKDLEIVLDSENAEPGSDFLFRIKTYDQANDLIQEDISLIIYKPEDFIFLKKLIKPDIDQIINLEFNNTPGYWKIEASAGEINKKKLFYLEQIQKIQTSLINGTLIVTNIGNVLYEKPLEITIGSTVEVKQLRIDIGETRKFKLKAPEGNYQISINDGSGVSVLGTTFLTGNAIRVVDLRRNFLEAFTNPLIWWMVVIIFVLIVIFVYVKRKVANRFKGNVSQDKLKVMDKKYSSEIMNGRKEQAYVIAIKNRKDKNSEYISQTINKALTVAKDSGAKVYIDGDYKIIVFSQRLTKKPDNEISAVTIAKRIDSILTEHNQHYKDKIVYGLGVNDGEIISELIDGQFKFTTVDNLIIGAKRIAQGYDMKALLSETMHRKVAGVVKTKKSDKRDSWEITRINDRSKHEDFLKKFKTKK